jgi:hypothetical protein
VVLGWVRVALGWLRAVLGWGFECPWGDFKCACDGFEWPWGGLECAWDDSCLATDYTD